MRSPLKDKPLPVAGQSLDKRIRDILDDKFSIWIHDILFGFLMLMMSGMYLVLNPPKMMMFFGFFIYVVIICSIRIPQLIRIRKKIRQLALGRNGERIVGEILAELDAVVLHDIVMGNFNIDHVVISKYGIFLMETKTRSKPSKGQANIKYDGYTLDINGFITKEPLIQAKALAKELQSLICNLTGKSFYVQPAVIFPGWFIRYQSVKANQDVLVANPKMLNGLVEKSHMTMTHVDQKIVSEALKRFVRTAT